MAKAYATASDLPPEFSSVDAAVSAYWLDMAKPLIGLDAWGTAASQAHALLAAHYMKLNGLGTGGGGGAVASRTVGPVSESYAVTAPSDGDLGSTSYGLQYLALRRAYRPPPRAIRSSAGQVVPP